VVTYDISNRTISHSIPERFHVNRDLREIFFEAIQDSSPYKGKGEVTFRASMSTQDSKATFGDFAALEDWIEYGRPRDFRPHYKLNPRGPWLEDPSITLNFRLDQQATLENIRVEVSELIFRSFPLSLEATICVHLQMEDDEDTESPTRAYATQHRLRCALLVFFSDIIKSCPELQSYHCPRIWADGHLRLREAVIVTKDSQLKTIRNEKYNWTTARLNREKKKCLRRYALGAVDTKWGAVRDADDFYESIEPHKPPLVTYETLLSCTTFLARFIKQCNHPKGQCATYRCAPWRLLGELRKH
jgi:hypothetical protein